jgi:hypothetical protein
MVQLLLVEKAHIFYRDAPAFLKFRGKCVSRPEYLFRRNPDRVGSHPVEALGVLKERLVPPLADIGYYATGSSSNLLREKAARTSELGNQLFGLSVAGV